MSSDLNTLLSGWDDEAGWLSTGNLGQDFVVAQTPGSPTIMDTAGNTGSFVGGTWTPTPDTTNVSWMSQIPKGLQDVLKGLTSPAGIAGLGGAALGYLDRPQPSGGGTTMAYPGAQQITRKIVQGPYGPLAEYSGFGMPDYGTQAPTGPGAGQSVQSKIDQYKLLQGYGLAPEAIRRIAESIYGPQTDRDWAELTRLVGGSGGISGTGGGTQTTTPATTTTDKAVQDRILASAQSQKDFQAYLDSGQMDTQSIDELAAALLKFQGSTGMGDRAFREAVEKKKKFSDEEWEALQKRKLELLGVKSTTPPATSTTTKPTGAAVEELETYMTRIADYLPQFNPDELAAIYNHFKLKGLTNENIRSAVEKVVGGQSDQNWEYLKNISSQMPADLLAKAPNLGVNTIKSAVAAWKKGGKAQGGIIQGYARGGAVQMEDGGFVMTKRAVDGAGGPRGIQQLVPGARMIGGPADPTGKRDLTPAVINGPRGQTPAKVSRGEAYVPKRVVQDHGGPQRMYALMNSLQRKA